MNTTPSPETATDPFTRLRHLGSALLVVIGARASMPVLNLATVGLPASPAPEPVGTLTFNDEGVLEIIPPSDAPPSVEWPSALDGVLLDVEFLLGLAAVVLFAVWIALVLRAIRTRGTLTKYPPIMAVVGWIIPLVNLAMPWLTARDALESLAARRSWLAGLWWLLFLPDVLLYEAQSLLRELGQAPEVLPGFTPEALADLHMQIYWLYFAVDTAAWAMMLAVVVAIRRAAAPTGTTARGA